MTKRRAFTLVEILITLIIIGALGGMKYLAFGGADESAKAKACEGNRVAIKTAYDMYKFSAGASAVSLDEFVTHISNYKDFMTNEPECPYGEAYHYSVDPDNGKLVVCNHPTTTGPLVAAKPFGDSSSIAKIIDVMINNYGGISEVDSLAADYDGTKAKIISDELKKQGINLEEMDATIWKYNKDGTLLWTTVDVNTLKDEDSVPIIRYNPSYKTYSICSAIIENKYNDVIKQSYLTIGKFNIGTDEIPESKNVNKEIKDNSQKTDKMNYEYMKAIYDNYLKTFNF